MTPATDVSRPGEHVAHSDDVQVEPAARSREPELPLERVLEVRRRDVAMERFAKPRVGPDRERVEGAALAHVGERCRQLGHDARARGSRGVGVADETAEQRLGDRRGVRAVGQARIDEVRIFFAHEDRVPAAARRIAERGPGRIRDDVGAAAAAARAERRRDEDAHDGDRGVQSAKRVAAPRGRRDRAHGAASLTHLAGRSAAVRLSFSSN
jgi:hypothetical protein